MSHRPPTDRRDADAADHTTADARAADGDRQQRLTEEQRLLLERLLAAEGISPDDAPPPIGRRGEADELPLSFAQQRLWLLDQLQPGSPAYNVPKLLRLRGPLDVAALSRALTEVARRHEALRTTFEARHGSPRQRIHPPAPVPLPLSDLSRMPESEREAEAEALLVEEARRPFDLEGGPLWRASLVRLSEGEHALALVLHHIVSDGWSLGVLLRELSALYGAYARGAASPLAQLPIQYADYALWQRRWLRGEPLERRLSYWREQLRGAPEVLSLPGDRARPAAVGWGGASARFEVGAGVAGGLGGEARRRGVTLFMLLLSAFKVLLWRHAGEGDLCVGTPAAGRGRVEVEGLIGFFVNTLVLRTRVEGREGFASLVGRVREACLGAYQHQEVPFEKLVEELAPGRSLSHAPLFQVMFTMMGGPEPRLELEGVRAEAWEVARETTKFDLTVGVGEREGGGLGGVLQYSTELFDERRMRGMARRWERLLTAVAEGFEGEVRQMPVLDGGDERLLLGEWAGAGAGAAQAAQAEECLHLLFERQAARRGEEIAVIDEGDRLSYRELNERADGLARRLRQLGVGPEVRVGVLAGRALATVAALLAVLKAGGAYVPLDPEYPQERLAFMLEDARIKVLLTERRLAGRVKAGGAEVLLLDELRDGAEEDDGVRVESGVRPENLAYVIYTSGSTGRPKGVAIEHRSAVALLHWAKENFDAEDLGGVLASSSICFALSVFELFVPLAWGGKVILAENVLYLHELPAAEEVRLINTVPSAMAELLRMGRVPASVRTVNLAGEALPRALVQRIYEEKTVAQVVNLYGPSEDTTYSTFELVRRDEELAPPIGRPLDGTRAYVLDEYLQLVPPGSRGELYLSGSGLARGYLGRPALTAERFVPDPFSTRPGARLYQTGDVCRHLADGRLEFLGRADHQVKVRGFRVELGEVEAAVTGHAAVREAVAVARDDEGGQKQLVAYVVAHDPAAFNVGELRDHLKAQLPRHMVPSAFVLLERLPLNAGGKLDRAALPPPEYSGSQTDATDSGPRTQTEEVIAKIFCQTLGLKQVGVEDNFFELGGHSLLATQVVSRVRELLRVELPLRALFEAPTVSGLARLVSAGETRPGQTETIARLLMRVRRMSPEDARRLLNKDDQP